MPPPLDDYRLDPDFMDKKIKHDFLALLPSEEELLWMGHIQRGNSYWFSKGLLAVLALIGCLLLSLFLSLEAYLGFIEGDFAGRYNRVFIAIGAALLPWIASYFLIFRRVIYDVKTRYAISTNYVLLYLPVQKNQAYQWQALADLGELRHKSHWDKTGTISYAIEVPDEASGAIGLIFIPLFEFIEDSETIFEQLVILQAQSL